MQLNFTVDTDDLYGEDGIDFESILTDSLLHSIVNDTKSKVASKEFKEFSQLASDTVMSDIKLRMQNFLSEEIALHEGWGKPTFVGSIEDLIKKRFDEILLRPVDSSGETIKGCTTSENKTWIEWKIGDKLQKTVDRQVKQAVEKLSYTIKKTVETKITELKDGAIKSQVDAAFASILTQSE